MTSKIVRLVVKGFRGVPGEAILDFTNENTNKPVSLVLSGDNGTGKSSFVDALEFGLQGQIRKSSKSAFSLAIQTPPDVHVLLSDGSIISRRMVFNGKKWKLADDQPHKNFSISPFVLRRSDILRFIETPDISRQRIFLEYFKGSIGHTSKLYEAQEIQGEQIQEKINQKLISKRNAIAKFAKMLNVNIDEVPNDIKLFNLLVNEQLYKGMPTPERYRRIKKGEKLIPPHLYQKIVEIRKFSSQISGLKKELKRTTKESRKTDTTVLQSILSDAGDRLTDAFKTISPNNYVDRIFIRFNDISDMSLTIVVRLVNGKQTSPHHIFSEANLDLLSLLLFTSVLQESARHGQEKVLVLDDVFQSVDASIRVSVINHIMREFSDWQLIFTLHDRLWKSQLRETLRKNGHQFVEKDILRWSFDNGPVIATTKETKEMILAAVDRGELISICAQSGVFLEFMCDKLSLILPISVTRRKEDKYTLGDLWPGVAKSLKKTSVKEKVENVENWIHIRNLVGAHFNEWALSLSFDEAAAFANSILQLHNAVYCEKCFSWIAPVLEGRNGYMCRCESIRILPLKA